MAAQTDLDLDDYRLPIGGTALQCRLAEAAIELFSSRGAPATTVREITAACGLSPGSLYNHFTSKEQLLYVLVRDVHLQFDARMAAVVASAGPDPATQLAGSVRLLVARTAGHNKRSRVANREFTALTGSRRDEIIILRRQIRDRLTGILVDGSQAGIFVLPGGDDLATATLTSATIGTMCVHISRWTLEHLPLTLPQLQDRYVEMALRIAGKSG
jgi:TetR/AcrR family transcriptional regulator, cholesterol catabolism regulator